MLKTHNFFRAGILALGAAWILAACGGGGGGDAGAINLAQGPGFVPTTTTTITTTTTTTIATTVTVAGTATYDLVPVNPTNGSLVYASTTAAPIRGATVELLSSSGAVLATTQTSAIGQYAFTTAPGSTTLAVRVRAEIMKTSGTGQWDVTIGDNTNGGALYAMQSSNFNSGTGKVQNLAAASGWGGTSYTTTRTAAPFAILDTIYTSQQKVLSAQSNAVFPALKVFWSVNNVPASGGAGIPAGNIGTSFYRATTTNGLLSKSEMFILGQADVDTDEYDSSVIAHEWGHYYQSAFSRDDSVGGSHGGIDDRLDRRVAFSEGWGNGLSGIVLNKDKYADSRGSGQTSGFVLNLNSGYGGGGPKGWFRESSVQHIIWKLSQQAGFTEVHQAMSGTAFKNGSPLTDIHSFSAAYRSTAGASSTKTAALNTLLGSETISTTDAYGAAETNNGGKASTIPYYRQLTAAGATTAGQTLCSSSASGGSTDTTTARNKLAYFVYARFTLVNAASTITVATTTTTPGANVDFELYKSGQLVYTAEAGSGLTETQTQALTAGEHILVIYDFNRVGDVCYTVTIN
jgi:hypothetical protein